MRKTIPLLIAALAVSACAQSPSAIQPVSMTGAYDETSCSKARVLMVEEQERLAALSSQQSGAVAGDAIGVFLIGVPVSSLTGNDKAGDIATSKGKINALEARLISC